MAVQSGFTRFRKHQFGKQSVHGTAVAATRAIGWRGIPSIDPNWQDQADVDMGSIDPVLQPFRTQTDITVPGLGGNLTYNDIPILLAGGVRGGVSGVLASGAYTWTHQALSLTATTLDEFTDEWSDDVTGDGFRMRDGVVENIEWGFDETLGPWQVSADWRFGYMDPRSAPTAGLLVGSNLPLVFGADTQLFIDSTSGAIGGTQISDALHRASITIANTIDQKRYANGSNSRFQIAGYGLAERAITAEFAFAKSTAIYNATGEVAQWLSADPVNRYLKVLVTSPSIVAGAIPYSWDQRFSGTWRTRSDEDLGGNSIIVLSLTGRYDSTLGYAYRSAVVNSLPTLP